MMNQIILSTNTPQFSNDISDVIRLMLPGYTVSAEDVEPGQAYVRHVHSQGEGFWHERCEYSDGEAHGDFEWSYPTPDARGNSLIVKRLAKRAAKLCCYYMLRRVTGTRPPWGSLTGIRPTRLYAEHAAAGSADPARTLSLLYDVRDDKAALLAEIAEAQRPFIAYDAGAVDVYVAIPYCVTKCAYCAFHSELLPKNAARLDEYMSALLYEIGEAARLASEHGLAVRAIYIGGGTPTSLDAGRLGRLLDILQDAFPCAAEWTVEAGRPDTIDAERLRAIRSHAVTRISVNPQTMNDATLARIGRAHTASQTLEAFALARAMGFRDINMDLIAGLPGETFEDFAATLDAVCRMEPDSLTVHTLARKRASKLYGDPSYAPVGADQVDAMISAGADAARGMGMVPYYLYRQKNMAGNFENVGYAKPIAICRYNLDMMEETTSVIALGAGAISKRVTRGDDRQVRIERAPNMMEPERYVERVAEMAERKIMLFK